MASEAAKILWKRSIPVQIHLHKSEVAPHPAPPPALLSAPWIGYLPLLVPFIKPYFKDSLPPGDEDSIWFDYKGIPLKWDIPTGVLFDLLCTKPEIPWNLTIHFRGYPSNIMTPCEGEDSVKLNFFNSLQEAANVINGNCKNVMNMSQSDQEDLWISFWNSDLDAYTRLLPKLKMRTIKDKFLMKTSLSSPESREGVPVQSVQSSHIRKRKRLRVKTARVSVRLYVRSINKDFENLEDVHEIDHWDDITYLNSPFEFIREEGKCCAIHDTIKSLLPGFIGGRTSGEARTEDESDGSLEMGEIKWVRVQGIEMKPDEVIPFSWLVDNLTSPEFNLYISVLFVKAPQR